MVPFSKSFWTFHPHRHSKTLNFKTPVHFNQPPTTTTTMSTPLCIHCDRPVANPNHYTCVHEDCGKPLRDKCFVSTCRCRQRKCGHCNLTVQNESQCRCTRCHMLIHDSSVLPPPIALEDFVKQTVDSNLLGGY